RSGSRRLDHRRHALRKPLPLRPPARERLAPARRDCVDAPTTGAVLAPGAVEEAVGLEAVQRGIDGAFGGVGGAAARPPGALDDAVAVARPGGPGGPQRQIEGTGGPLARAG